MRQAALDRKDQSDLQARRAEAVLVPLAPLDPLDPLAATANGEKRDPTVLMLRMEPRARLAQLATSVQRKFILVSFLARLLS